MMNPLNPEEDPEVRALLDDDVVEIRENNEQLIPFVRLKRIAG